MDNIYRLISKKVNAAQLDKVMFELSGCALFERESGAIIDVEAAREQVGDLSAILPHETDFESIDKNKIDYIEFYL